MLKMIKIYKIMFILVLFGALVISGCNLSKPTCNEPYILVGNDCCLDQNNNKICDNDETSEVKEKIEQQKSLEKLKEVVENTTEGGVYDVISKAFDKYCWFNDGGSCREYDSNNLSKCLVRDEPQWTKVLNAQTPNCNTDQDCIDLAKNWGTSEEDLQEVIKNGLKCSLEKPS